MRRVVFCAILLVFAVIIEVTVLAPLPFPGATPGLVLVTVAALSFSFGPVTGAVCGFAGGLMLDLAPPATGTIGVTALLLTLIGYALGRIFDSDDRPVFLTTSLTAAAAALAVLASAALGGLLGNPRVQWDQVIVMILTAALYAGLLSIPLVPLVRRWARRLAPEAFSR